MGILLKNLTSESMNFQNIYKNLSLKLNSLYCFWNSLFKSNTLTCIKGVKTRVISLSHLSQVYIICFGLAYCFVYKLFVCSFKMLKVRCCLTAVGWMFDTCRSYVWQLSSTCLTTVKRWKIMPVLFFLSNHFVSIIRLLNVIGAFNDISHFL